MPTALPHAYSKEAHLVDFAHRYLHSRYVSEGTTCFAEREVGVGSSIADLVLLIAPQSVSYPPASLVSVAESVILAALRQGGPTRIDLLEMRCGFERRGLRQGALKRLTTSGVLLLQRGGRVTLAPEYSHAAKIVAIEAKLTKWRDALNQAALYRRYADESFVLLPSYAVAPAIKAAGEFQKAGVGLLGATDTEIITIIEAPTATAHDWRRDFVFSRLISSQTKPAP